MKTFLIVLGIVFLLIIIVAVFSKSFKVEKTSTEKEKFISECVNKFPVSEYYLNYQHILFTCENKWNNK